MIVRGPGYELRFGDCLELLQEIATSSVDVSITDPPYGVTSLGWDIAPGQWLRLVGELLNASGSVWMFGSLRSIVEALAGEKVWRMAQDIVWEKHNGSNFHNDRFRRVHELAVHLYRGAWADVYKSPVMTHDATKRTVHRKGRPAHMGEIGEYRFESHNGGPRLMRSVIKVRSCHGAAVHPTQKPIGIVEPLIEYSSPPKGVVLDPFMGSGTTGVACLRMGRAFIGIEKDERHFETAVKRLEREAAQGKLFVEES